MPGTMDDNLRRAFLQEELGAYLLRGFCAVATVPRPQDTGIDAIATLLRRETTRQLIAEKSFYVQLKAGSVESVTYDRLQLEWFGKLRLPFFIGKVNPQGSKISLFTCHRLAVAMYEWSFDSIEVVLGPSKNTGEWKKESKVNNEPLKRKAVVWLGEPVLEWGVGDISVPGFLQQAYELLKPILDIEDSNIHWRPIKFIAHMTWGRKSSPAISHYGIGSHGFDELDQQPAVGSTQEFYKETFNRGLKGILKELSPYIIVWAMHCLNCKQHGDWKEVFEILKVMKSKGVDPDEKGVLEELSNRIF